MRSVLFIDPPAFCTTVEGSSLPRSAARPLAVAPPGADRATILALSAEARLAGLTRGMAVRPALKLCPDLVLLPPNPRLYARASRALHEVLRIYAPVIEPRGYGHAFLDLTGTGRLFGPAVDVAERIQREVRERLRLPLSVGVAANKLVSRAGHHRGQARAAARGAGRSGGRLSRAPSARRPPRRRPAGSAAGSTTTSSSSSARWRPSPRASSAPSSAARAARSARRPAASTRARCCRPSAAPSSAWPIPSPPTPTTSACCMRCCAGSPSGWAGGSASAASRRGGSGSRPSTTTTPPSPAPCPSRRRARRRALGRRPPRLTQANTRRLAVRAVALTLDRLDGGIAARSVGGRGRRAAEGGEDGEDGQCHPYGLTVLTALPLQHAMDRIHTRYGARALTRPPHARSPGDDHLPERSRCSPAAGAHRRSPPWERPAPPPAGAAPRARSAGRSSGIIRSVTPAPARSAPPGPGCA